MDKKRNRHNANEDLTYMFADDNAERRKKRSNLRKKKRRNKRITETAIIITIFIVFVFAAVLIIKGVGGSGNIKGTWSVDTITVYEFGDDGKGALVLPTGRYDFVYTVDKKAETLSIDFEKENVTDVSYTYKLDGDTLILSVDNNEYKLTKENK